MSRRALMVTLAAAVLLLVPAMVPAAAAASGSAGSAAPPVFRAIGAGFEDTCAVTTAGALFCWGRNDAGQLGDGTRFDRWTPTEVVGLGGRTWAVAMGREHTCALSTAGGVRCWGDNAHGQLGNGTTTGSAVPVAVTGLAGGVAAIAAGDDHTCALLASGEVRCWGAGVNGATGNRSTDDALVPAGVVDIAAGGAGVTAGGFSGCAVLSYGGVLCWGDGTAAPAAVSGLASGVAGVGAGHQHTCAVLVDGTARCWGQNGYGQLGDGTTAASATPVNVTGLTGATDVEGGYVHTCAMDSAGAAWCWGDNRWGQLGTGSTAANGTTPVAVSGLTSGVAAIAVGDFHSCALTTAGVVTCWGRNDFGALGDGTTATRRAPATLRMVVPQAMVLRSSAKAGTYATGTAITFTGTGRPYPTTTRLWGIQFVIMLSGAPYPVAVWTLPADPTTGRASMTWTFTKPGSYSVRARAVAQPGYADSAWTPFIRYTIQ